LRYPIALVLACVCAASVAGCGSDDRSALAKQAIINYWSDINHAKFNAAYGLLTSGNRAVMDFSQYQQNMFGFLEHVAGIHVDPGTPDISDDRATVPIKFRSPKAPGGAANFYQHLFWENGGWRIADQNGGVSQNK
jgi:hypothetical protein